MSVIQNQSAPHVSGMSWTEPALADVSHRPRTRLLVVWVVIVVGAVCDAGVLLPAVIRVLRIAALQAWPIAIAVTAVATAVAGTAGWMWRGENGNHPGRRYGLVVPILMLIGWFCLGLVIGALRLEAASLATSAGFEGATTHSSGNETVAAAVFLAIYLLTGGLAAADLYHQRNDAFSTLTTVRREMRKVDSQLEVLEALNVRLKENLAVRRSCLADLDDQTANELRGNAALAEELKQLSRLEQVAGLGRPSATGVTSAAHPDNPAHQNAATGPTAPGLDTK